jgi:hypothetical protein
MLNGRATIIVAHAIYVPILFHFKRSSIVAEHSTDVGICEYLFGSICSLPGCLALDRDSTQETRPWVPVLAP